MIRAVGYLLTGALAASAWTVSAEAGNGNPTGGKFAEKHPRRNEVNTRVDNQRERINQGLKNGTLTGRSSAPMTALSSSRSRRRQSQRRISDWGGAETVKPRRERQQSADSRRETSAVAKIAHEA